MGPRRRPRRGQDLDKFTYGYDRNSNRLYRRNVVDPNYSELYHPNDPTANTEYDGLDRLREFRRGVLSDSNRSITGTPRRSQSWTLDALGNWASNTMDGNSTQTRTHNLANEITDLSDTANDPNYDARGNVTADPNLTYKYDAWNRLAEVRKRSDNSLVAAYRYDGVNRRIAKLLPNGQNWSRTDYYYNLSWQVLEERYNDSQADPNAVATVTRAQYVWSGRYVDAPVCRFRDTTGDGNSDETLYYLTDAQMNVTALVDANGAVVERCLYDAYGSPTICDGNWTAITWSNSRKNEVLYCGYRYDPETGNYHVRNRVLAPGLGRWVQRDPGAGGTMRVGAGGAAPVGQFIPTDPTGQYRDGPNLDQYVSGNPLNYVDPSGSWKSGGHKELLKKSYDRFWQWRAQQRGAGGSPGSKCSAGIYDILETADLSQDSGQAFNENFRHYNRDLNEDPGGAKKKFQDYIAKEISWFNYEMNQVEGKRDNDAKKQPCINALWSLGRVTHTWQDYYAHALLASNGSAVAWSVGITGSPDNDNAKLRPSSWGNWHNWGEHGGSEPASRDKPGGEQKRKDDAENFVFGKYKTYLHQWYNKCWCCCPEK